MTRSARPLLAAALAALSLLATACGGSAADHATAADQADPAAIPSQTATPGVPERGAAWLTAEERDAVSQQGTSTTWLAAVFLPEGAARPLRTDELEVRYLAYAPAEGQLDMVPAAEALAALRGAEPEGLDNPLGALDLQLLAAEVADSAQGTVLTVDFGEGIAASRSASSTEGQLAFNQLVGMLALHFPEADLAQLTVEDQAEPELFGGIDTTRPFALRQ